MDTTADQAGATSTAAAGEVDIPAELQAEIRELARALPREQGPSLPTRRHFHEATAACERGDPEPVAWRKQLSLILRPCGDLTGARRAQSV